MLYFNRVSHWSLFSSAGAVELMEGLVRTISGASATTMPSLSSGYVWYRSVIRAGSEILVDLLAAGTETEADTVWTPDLSSGPWSLPASCQALSQSDTVTM